MTYELDIDGRCIRSEDLNYLVELNGMGEMPGVFYEIRQSRMNLTRLNRQTLLNDEEIAEVKRWRQLGRSKEFMLRRCQVSEKTLNNILKPGE